MRLAEIPPAAAGDIRVEERPGSCDLYAGDRFVLSVTEADAMPTGRTRQQLAADFARNLREALEREAKGRGVRGILVAVLLTVIATAPPLPPAPPAPRRAAALRAHPLLEGRAHPAPSMCEGWRSSRRGAQPRTSCAPCAR